MKTGEKKFDESAELVLELDMARILFAEEEEEEEEEARIVVSLKDITERKRAEEALRETEERYNSLFDRSLDSVYINDFAGKFIDANQAALELLGYTRDEIMDLNFASLLTPDQLSTALKGNQEIIATGTQQESTEYRVRRKDGGYATILTNAALIYQNGKPYAVQGIAHDITERKRAEEALRASEAKYRLVVENANEAIAVAQDGMLKFVNRMAIDLTGYSEQDLTSRPFPEFVHPDDRGMVVEHYLRRLKGDVSQSRYVFRLMVRDGSIKWLEIGAVLIDWEGNPATLNFFSDVTERKLAEEALQESEKRHRTVLQTAMDGFWMTDMQGQLLDANDAYCQMSGYSALEMLAMRITDLEVGHSASDIAARIQTIMAQGGEGRFESRHRRKDGSVFEVEISIQYQPTDGGRLVAFLRDITERKRGEEEIRRKAKELQEKNEELTRFTHAVSHDLRSPLVTIQTFQGHLEKDIRSQDAARVEKDLGYIRNAADKMGRLLDDIRRLSRVGRIINPSEEAPLQAIVKEALDLVAGRISRRGVKVQVTEEPVVLFGDRTRLIEVFMNLVDNAVKFMGDEPAPRVEIGVEQAGEELVLHVRDNGIGIDPELQPLVFGLFHKLDPGSEGEGIGLALVKRIVELHGGRIWVESEGPGKGTTFRFTLAKTRRGVGREQRT